MGALLAHITGDAEAETYQPMNVNFGLFPPLDAAVKKKQRKEAYTSRAKVDLATWLEQRGERVADLRESEAWQRVETAIPG
jgi:methylenetetrahydrofolate--tRNA-(uracil-5-)-methyltransferase